MVRAGLPLAAAGCAALVLLGFLGALHPALDTIGQARAHAAVPLIPMAIALGFARRFAACLGALTVAALGLCSVLPFVPASQTSHAALSGAPRYTLLQMNLRWDAGSHAEALSLIARQRPDVVTLQEMTEDWRRDLERLSSAYPYQFHCAAPFHRGDTAILSRRPFVETEAERAGRAPTCLESERFSAKTIDFNGLPVAIASQHLRWPWPGAQPRMVAALSPSLGEFGDPLIVAGDFNAAPWSDSLRRYAESSRTRVVGGVGPTWISRLLPTALARHVGLPIDNVLVSDGIEVLGVKTLAPTASDHLPVLLTFTMRFALPEEPEVESAGR